MHAVASVTVDACVARKRPQHAGNRTGRELVQPVQRHIIVLDSFMKRGGLLAKQVLNFRFPARTLGNHRFGCMHMLNSRAHGM